MGSKLALYGPVGVATAVGLLSGVFYAYVVTNKSFVTTLYSSAYWGVLALMWMICIWIKFTNLHFAITNAHHKQSDSEKHAPSLTSGLAGNKSLLFPALIVSGLCGLLSLLSFGGYLAARTPDKVAAIFVALNIINIAIFCWIHIQAASLNTTVASAIRKKKGALLYTLYIIIAAIASFFALLIHFGATIQAMGLAVDNVRFGTPPGVMVKLQDFPYSVHLFCTGRKLNASDPLIWIEHGLGGSMLDFSWVIANVSSYARVCSYDRPGLGWSDTGALPRTTPQFTKELQSLLRSADIKDDLFMVGHSMAGFNIRSAQRQLETNRVVGVVLVDPVDQLVQKPCGEDIKGKVDKLYLIGQETSTFGLSRAVSFSSAFPAIDNIRSLPSNSSGPYLANILLTWNMITRVAETRDFPRSCGFVDRIVKTSPHPIQSTLNNTIPPNDETLGSLPYGLVVVTNGINATNLERLSTNRVVARSDTADHVGILHREGEARLVNDVVGRVWANMLAAKRARGE